MRASNSQSQLKAELEHLADKPRPEHGAREVVDRPHRAAVPGPPLLPESTSVELPRNRKRWPAFGEAGEVVGAFVHVLEERRLGIDQPVRLQHAPDLLDHLLRVEHVLEHRLDHHRVDRSHRAAGMLCASAMNWMLGE